MMNELMSEVEALLQAINQKEKHKNYKVAQKIEAIKGILNELRQKQQERSILKYLAKTF
jgi:membrane protein required for beta-lactamase induction